MSADGPEQELVEMDKGYDQAAPQIFFRKLSAYGTAENNGGPVEDDSDIEDGNLASLLRPSPVLNLEAPSKSGYRRLDMTGSSIGRTHSSMSTVSTALCRQWLLRKQRLWQLSYIGIDPVCFGNGQFEFSWSGFRPGILWQWPFRSQIFPATIPAAPQVLNHDHYYCNSCASLLAVPQHYATTFQTPQTSVKPVTPLAQGNPSTGASVTKHSE